MNYVLRERCYFRGNMIQDNKNFSTLSNVEESKSSLY